MNFEQKKKKKLFTRISKKYLLKLNEYFIITLYIPLKDL